MQGLKYISWGDTTGYAVAAKAYVRALDDAGLALTWTPMLTGANLYEPYTSTQWPCPQLAALCNKALDYDTVLIHTVPEYYLQWIGQERRAGRRIFGYTVWEHEKLPDHWPQILNQLDGVIVPCSWNREVFQRSGVTVPIHVVAHLSQFEGLPAPSAHDRNALLQRLGGETVLQERFVFYNVGFWSNRKAPYLAVEAYLQAFTASDPVLLIVKTSARDITRLQRHWRNAFRRRHPSPLSSVNRLRSHFPRPAAVVVIADETLSDGEMLALHERADCFVSLARTEGWGLGAFEAARLGKPVVMTGYGGQLDFLDPALARLVDYRLVLAHEPLWPANYRAEDQWAEPSIEQAARHLREVFEAPLAARRQAQQLATQIAGKFSKTAVVAALLKALS